jgi:hypothetical protein
MCPGANEGDSDSGITNIPNQNKTEMRKKRSDSPELKEEKKKEKYMEMILNNKRHRINRKEKKDRANYGYHEN